ncbi:AAA family ATPase [Halomonas sp. MCCC 1A17488]|uniref:ATP-dependent nuclease n=1 Tax=unclassified Halomonas TaxID=2609666 RepID=UPI0018D2491A|nr:MULTISPECIES: AAA family ATPase [unclassified Halomonas]MCE8016630.1 AAA family ATPase [Halomonas sp. MCCC 1A17488]MCG3239963.1 AAA family ATPase [Halomonas sp. MCCC 1A17488]QPP50145.1 AAA family ATPase [Halomonas sp. SS10-MC5]
MRAISLREVRISNYRSIRDEQVLIIGDESTLIGPNNAGKTNSLRAISILFGGYDNAFNYDRELDIPFDRQSKKTSIIGLFEIDESELWFWDAIDKLHVLQGTKRENNQISLYLYFTETNTPVYNFFTNVKRPQDKKADYSRILRALVSDFISKFQVVYIPSEKSIDDLYRSLLAPRLSSKAAAILSSAMEDLDIELNSINKSINNTLRSSQIEGAEVQIEVPGGSLENIIGQFSLAVTDEVKTSYTSKGRGLQAAIFYASLHWIDERIKEAGQNPVWLIEEPESYMHPELANNSKDMVRKLAKKSISVVSTHSMQFMPKIAEGIHGFNISSGSTIINRFVKFDDACSSLKRSLGIRFSDYYGLANNNVFVEGKWDVYVIKNCVSKVSELSGQPLSLLSEALVVEREGTTGLAGFIKAVYEHVRKEVAAVTVLDGDAAGVKARRELQGFFSGRGEFVANKDFVSVRAGYEMEGIFPDEWIKECYKEHEGWFEGWSVDASGELEPFSIKDRNKESYAKYMCEKVLSLSAGEKLPAQVNQRLFNFFKVLDEALFFQQKKLAAESII